MISLILNSWNILFVVLLICILGMQLFFLFKKANLKRRTLKIALNILLWISIVVLVFPPRYNLSTRMGMLGIKSNGINRLFVNKISDSLKIRKVVSETEFVQTITDEQLVDFKQIVLIGNDFGTGILNKLSDKKLTHFQFFEPDQVQDLAWKAILKQNENQNVLGKLNMSQAGFLKLKFGNTVLDSQKVQKGIQNFKLGFPSFAVGKTNVDLWLEDKFLYTIHFFSSANKPLNILFLLPNPDFETKTLANWLAKNGHQVETQTNIAKDTKSIIKLNSKLKVAKYDIVITSPEFISNGIVNAVHKAGGGVFFMNLGNVNNSLKAINNKYSTKFKSLKIADKNEITLENEIISLPFKFDVNPLQNSIMKLPIAVDINKVGVSFLTQTYHLQLSGDTIAYQKIWGAVLNLMYTNNTDNILVNAPILQNLSTEVKLNNLGKHVDFIKIDNDTLGLTKSAINASTYTADYSFRKPGWVNICDSAYVFTEPNQSSFVKNRQTMSYVKAINNNESSNYTAYKKDNKNQLNSWWRFAFVLFCLSLVWVEPKI